MEQRLTINLELLASTRFHALMLGQRVDPDPVRQIQGCTPK